MKTRFGAKKRMMFIQKEDYNFLAYNTIILLKTLGCVSEQSKFNDFRKIAYLIDFINEGGNPSNFDQTRLADIYSKAQIKKKLLHHLIIALKNKNYIGLSLNTPHKSLDIWIIPENIPQNFMDLSFFKNEIDNIITLKLLARSLKTITIKELANRIFNNNNVLTWEV